MKKLMIMLMAGLMTATAFGQDPGEPAVKWYTMEQAVQLNANHPKKIYIYVYSDHCGWCRKMAGNTLTDPVIAKYLNEKYYPVRLNVDMKEAVTVGSKTYTYVPADPSKGTPGYHEFIVAILQGYMAYPAGAFFDQNLTFLGVDRGYKAPADFEKLLHYIGDNAYLENHDYGKYAAGYTGER